MGTVCFNFCGVRRAGLIWLLDWVKVLGIDVVCFAEDESLLG